jgi:SAM-dependent methyltransferase
MHKLIWKLKVWTGKAQRIVLQSVFKFDKWHIYTLTEKKYARDIIAYCNSRTVRNFFAEIGCGLGDIVRHVKYVKRFGFDSDEKSLKAARFLGLVAAGGKIHFSLFTFPDSPLTGKYDVIVLVNWIHHIDPVILKSRISFYFENALNPGGDIIVDTVQDPEYRFNHDIVMLTGGLSSVVKKLGQYERAREVWLISKSGT